MLFSSEFCVFAFIRFGYIVIRVDGRVSSGGRGRQGYGFLEMGFASADVGGSEAGK
jgi:hypothetical protein